MSSVPQCEEHCTKVICANRGVDWVLKISTLAQKGTIKPASETTIQHSSWAIAPLVLLARDRPSELGIGSA
ncbi:hypothetical protein EJB05_29152, partial [Eragrostis curvula]